MKKSILAFLAMSILVRTFAQEFTIVVIPDTQFYHVNYSYDGSGSTIDDFHSQLDWVVDNVAVRNIVFVSHLGDIVENGSQMSEWNVSSDIMGKIENLVPYGMCVGNHDADSWDPVAHGPWSRGYHNFTKVFPESRYATKEWYGDDFPDGTNWNNYQLFSAGGVDFLIVHIECWPPQEAVDWAEGIIAQYPERKVLISSHDHTGEIMAIAKRHANVFMFNRGHHPGESHTEVEGDHGQIIHDILVDYQGWHRGGHGYFRYYTFKPSENTVCATTYSNTTKQTLTDYCFDVNFNGTFLALTQLAPIYEGEENGAIINIELINGTFAATLNMSNWTVGNLPEGVTFGALQRISDTEAQITLSGNSVIGTYTANISNVSVTINPEETLDVNSAISSSSGVVLTMAPQVIPGLIQAESYASMSGIQLENTEDDNGGENVGWIDAGDWLTYEVNIKAATTYNLGIRAAAMSNAGQLQIQIDGQLIKTVDLSVTGGWQTWQTVETTIDLPSGVHNLTLMANNDGFNLNWFLFEAETALADPIIERVNHSPTTPSPRDEVSISAQIIDDVAVTSAKLFWGYSTGMLNNQVTMSLSSDLWVGSIPAQTDSTQVFYTVKAYDDDMNEGTSTAQSYTVFDPLAIPPSIENVANVPGSPNSTQDVLVNAIVTDNLGVDHVALRYGSSINDLTNELPMDSVGGVYSSTIPSMSDGSLVYFQIVATDSDGNQTVSDTYEYLVSDKRIFHSYNVQMSDGEIQGSVAADGISASLRFYESLSDNDVDFGTPFNIYNGADHPDAFNYAETFWTSGIYPYAGKNTVERGQESGESNAPSPPGVFDLQMHPPANQHLTVCEFEVPVPGYYKITQLGLRRVSANGNQVALRVFTGTDELTSLNASNDQAWVVDDQPIDLGALMPGTKLYFALDNIDDFSFDATEVLWTIEQSDVITGVEGLSVANPRVHYNPDINKYVVSGPSNFTYQISDVSGKMLYDRRTANGSEIDLSGLPAGIYFISLSVEGRNFRTKLVHGHI